MALHEVQLKGYSVRPGNLSLGTYDSYGIEQLHVTFDDTWSGLAIDATFHNTPNDKGVTMLVDTDGLVPVPPEACMRASKYATITFRGVQDGVQRISCNLPYVVLDHAQVPGANSTATPSEIAQALAQMQDLRDGAVDAKNQAEAARDAAANSAVAAKESETNAGQSATAAKTAQSAAETAKAGAETAQKAAASSASSASTSASTATTQAAAAKSSATTAKASEAAAAKSAKEAAASAANLDNAVNTATQKAAAASASAESAKASESAAASSEAAARKYANSAELAAKTAGEAAAEKLQQMQAIQDDVTAKQTQTATDATAAEKAKVAAEAAQKDAAASKAAAANSAAAAKTSEDAAAKSAADADSTANSINNSMMQIAANKEAVSQLKEDTTALQKRQNVLVGSETGNPVSCDDAYSAPLCGLTVYGKSMQDGTPSPDNPVPIVSAGDSGSVAVKVTGKNLFYEQEFQKYFINSMANTVGLADGNVSNVLQVVTGAKYYVTRNKVGTKFRVAVVDKLPTSGNPVTPSSGINADSKRQIEIFATSKYMVIQCEDEAAFSELMVSLDSSTAYSPYREQLLTLPTPNGLPGIPVTSGGNYTDQNGQQWICDEVDLERGVKVQRIGEAKILFVRVSNDPKWYDANKSYSYEITQFTSYFLQSSSAGIIGLDMCNRFTMFNFSNFYGKGIETGGLSGLHYGVFNISKTLGICTTAAEFKAWFNENVVLYKILATPIETALAPAQIAAYKALTAYAPDTVVQASDGAGIKLEYQRDVNIAIKKLEDAIASMTAT